LLGNESISSLLAELRQQLRHKVLRTTMEKPRCASKH